MRKEKGVRKRSWAEGEEDPLCCSWSDRGCNVSFFCWKNGWPLAERRKEKVCRCPLLWVHQWVSSYAIRVLCCVFVVLVLCGWVDGSRGKNGWQLRVCEVVAGLCWCWRGSVLQLGGEVGWSFVFWVVGAV